LTFRRAHELYNIETRTNAIVKRKIDKMRSKVDRIKNEVENSELSLISDIDVNKIYARGKFVKYNLGSQPPTQTVSSTSKDKSK
jgi:hypothetical protein